MSLQGPKLILPDDEKRVSKLKRKLSEYATRVEDYKKNLERENPTWHPEQIELLYKQFSEYFKLAVLSELLLKEKLDTYAFSLELQKDKGFNIQNYDGAGGVINDYCETGGANCQGGTGLV